MNNGRFAVNGEGWNLLFGALLWNLWLHRNEQVFNPQLVWRETVLQRSLQLQQDYSTLALSLHSHMTFLESVSREGVQWSTPPPDWCKLNSNGAVNQRTGGLGFARFLKPIYGEFMRVSWLLCPLVFEG
ncbi:hypothetical protein V6N12_044956 [Hibiscus sabdariffa]|uniref:Uncharacterized protein n=1 Tax=Hibiscus sabdariffa TaxID=183260 RepID=A0ABR2G1J4_9ROSI